MTRVSTFRDADPQFSSNESSFVPVSSLPTMHSGVTLDTTGGVTCMYSSSSASPWHKRASVLQAMETLPPPMVVSPAKLSMLSPLPPPVAWLSCMSTHARPAQMTLASWGMAHSTTVSSATARMRTLRSAFLPPRLAAAARTPPLPDTADPSNAAKTLFLRVSICRKKPGSTPLAPPSGTLKRYASASLTFSHGHDRLAK
mmetsp:Transcript_17867/g.49485  ORF Transcript_17867/g.49485 Transcript_17867/m.49485 type:complete len:200 (-) Transcript_17867:1367-1966(-)